MTIITIVYLLIAALVFVSTLYNMIFKEERIVDQINAAMVLVPLLLYIFLLRKVIAPVTMMAAFAAVLVSMELSQRVPR